MARIEGSLARTLDFGELPATVSSTGGHARVVLRLAPSPARYGAEDKYGILDLRRRRAQLQARRLLDLGELAEDQTRQPIGEADSSQERAAGS